MLRVKKKNNPKNTNPQTDSIAFTSINISPSELHKVNFTDAYLLNGAPRKKSIKHTLKSAVQRAYTNAQTVTIEFQTKYHGLLNIKANVLMLGQAFVVLKGGISIPLKSIQRVSL